MKCPICGSEIEIAEEIDYDELEAKDFEPAVAFLMEYPMYRSVLQITSKCPTCRKGLQLNFHKPSFPDKDVMRELAKELLAEKLIEKGEEHGTDTQE